MDIKCRTCLQLQNKFHSAFDYYKNGKLISDMLLECTTIKLQRSDALPTNMCNICLEKLDLAYEFRIMVIESDKKLHFSNTMNILQKYEATENNVLIVKEEIPVVGDNSPGNTQDGIGKSIVQCKVSETQLSVSLNKVGLKNTASSKQTSNKDKNGILTENVALTDFNFVERDKKTSIMEICPKSNYVTETNVNNKNIHDSGLTENANNMLEDSCDDDTAFHFSDHENLINSASAMQSDLTKTVPTDDRISSDSLTNSLNISSTYKSPKMGLSKTEKNKTTIFCKVCNRSFGYRYYFEIHVRNHTGEVPFKCEICGRGFAKRFLLKNHKLIHSDNKSYSCDKCGKAFKFLNSLIGHRVMHSDERPQYKCEMCGKIFTQMGALKTHIERHKDERQYTCEVCGKGFNCKTGLLHHMACHKSKKDVSCSACGKCFASNGRMKDHFRRSHSEEKPHACNYCNRHFNDKRVLRQHILIHTGAKPHVCKICGKSFRHTSTVSNHMRIHTGETPFSCELCPLKFKYKHHLSNHMKVHQ